MNAKKQKINTKLKELGKTLGLDETTSLKSKRTAKNIIAMAVVAGVVMVLGALLLPNGQPGYYYGGGGVRDFQIFFRGFF